MAAAPDLAALSDLLPAPEIRPRVRLRFLPGRRRPQGLEGIPERYRLQFLLLAADRLPGAPAADVTALAARAAARTRIPPRLLAGHPDEMDRWFKDHADGIAASFGELAGLWDP